MIGLEPCLDPILEERLQLLKPLLLEQAAIVRRRDRGGMSYRLRFREPEHNGRRRHRSIELGSEATAKIVEDMINGWRQAAARPTSNPKQEERLRSQAEALLDDLVLRMASAQARAGQQSRPSRESRKSVGTLW